MTFCLCSPLGDDAPWEDSNPDDEDQKWTNITGLDHGELYEVRIVAVNGKGVETRSEPRKIRIGPQSGKSKTSLIILAIVHLILSVDLPISIV